MFSVDLSKLGAVFCILLCVYFVVLEWHHTPLVGTDFVEWTNASKLHCTGCSGRSSEGTYALPLALLGFLMWELSSLENFSCIPLSSFHEWMRCKIWEIIASMHSFSKTFLTSSFCNYYSGLLPHLLEQQYLIKGDLFFVYFILHF